VLSYRGVFEGDPLPIALQRIIGLDPQDVYRYSPGLRLAAELTVADRQVNGGA